FESLGRDATYDKIVETHIQRFAFRLRGHSQAYFTRFEVRVCFLEKLLSVHVESKGGARAIGAKMVHGVTRLDRLRFLAVGDRIPKGRTGSLQDRVEAVGPDRKHIGFLDGLLTRFPAAENAEYAIRRTSCKPHVHFHRTIIEALFRKERVGVEVRFVEEDSIFALEIGELRVVSLSGHPAIRRLRKIILKENRPGCARRLRIGLGKAGSYRQL